MNWETGIKAPPGRSELDDPERLCYNVSTERALPIDGLLPLCVTKK